MAVRKRMRVVDAENLQPGTPLLCRRFGLQTHKPGVPVTFDGLLTKHRNHPAKMRVRLKGGFAVVNIRDVDLECPLQKLANEL